MTTRPQSPTPDPAVHLVELGRPFEFVSPLQGQPHVVWLISGDRTVTREEMNPIAAKLVQSGCVSVWCSGHACDAWEFAIDWASISRFTNHVVPESSDIFTNCLGEEELDEVAALLGTVDAFSPDPLRILVLAVGEPAVGPAAVEALGAYVRSCEGRSSNQILLHVRRELRRADPDGETTA